MEVENMKVAEELIREFLIFRGFTSTLHSFDKELATDIGKSFQVDKILDLIFSVYVSKFEAKNLFDLLRFLKNCFTFSDTDLTSVLLKLEHSILRYYVVSAVKRGRKDKVLEFFGVFGNDLIGRDQTWTSWFVLPYLQNPHLDPAFRVYFTDDWFRALHLSVRNFLSEIFSGTRTPALLKISSERNTVDRLKKEIKQLNHRLSQTHTLLEEKEALLRLSRSGTEEVRVSHDSRANSTSEAEDKKSAQIKENARHKESRISKDNTDDHADGCQSSDSHESPRDDIAIAMLSSAGPGPGVNSPLGRLLHAILVIHAKLVLRVLQSCGQENADGTKFSATGRDCSMPSEDEFPEVKPVFQDTFLGHTNPISCCRFSASGDNIASSSIDGTVRIWTYDSSAPTSRNATIYCGAEITCLEWDCKSDRLLLIGTSDGTIKAWNVDAKRVVCDLNSNEAYPVSILDLKCSPVEPIFVSAAASKRQGSSYIDNLGFASLTVWNMRTWRPMTVLPLGKDPPAITSLSFNHNGKLLAAAATDGMIHMFDMSAGQQVTGWPAHDSAITSIRFGPDETSIFSLGADGNIFEWSLHNQGKILWSRNCSRPNNSNCRHEMALNVNGTRLLVSSSSERAPIYQVGGRHTGMRTLSHTGSVTTVDWHPTLPIFLTGSADHSVRVTSIS